MASKEGKHARDAAEAPLSPAVGDRHSANCRSLDLTCRGTLRIALGVLVPIGLRIVARSLSPVRV